jgi:hypothetical protein
MISSLAKASRYAASLAVVSGASAKRTKMLEKRTRFARKHDFTYEAGLPPLAPRTNFAQDFVAVIGFLQLLLQLYAKLPLFPLFLCRLHHLLLLPFLLSRANRSLEFIYDVLVLLGLSLRGNSFPGSYRRCSDWK